MYMKYIYICIWSITDVCKHLIEWCVYYSTIQISFSDLKKEIGNHSVISNFHFQFENEN